MKRLALVPLLLLLGCASVTLNTTCPPNSTGVGFALSGNSIGNTLLAMLSTGVAAGKIGMPVMAAAPAPLASATMTYHYVPIFGADNGSLNCTQPMPSPAPPVIVTTGPPASILPIPH